MAKVLIIDDEHLFCDMLSRIIRKSGHEVVYKTTSKEGFEECKKGSYDVVLLDVFMPDGNGLVLLPEIMQTSSKPEVIIMTGMATSEGAELAIKSGAWDYFPKDSNVQAMIEILSRAVQYREERLHLEPEQKIDRAGIIGNSIMMQNCMKQVAQAASTDTSVMIHGETGTGKELFAYAIHKNSNRKNEQFVIVDCTTLPEQLVESVLFGHAKGAFTDAKTSKKGLIEHAHKGTLFLDEIGELPLSVQKRFLRVLQEKKCRPVGENKEIESDFRLIAATNRNLEAMVVNGEFRKDLLYRISSFYLELPPLKERKKDIFQIMLYYTKKICARYNKPAKSFSPEFFSLLNTYSWPGNVRELINTIERAIAVAGDDHILYPKHIPITIRVELTKAALHEEGFRIQESDKVVFPDIMVAYSGLPMFKNFKKDMEIRYLKELMKKSDGNIKQACRKSGLSRSRLYALLSNYEINS